MSSPSLAATGIEKKAVTTNNPNIDLVELNIMLVPMTEEALFIEADSWMEILKTAAEAIASEKLNVRKKSHQIEKDQDEQATVSIEKEKKEQALARIESLLNNRDHAVNRLDTVLLAINEKTGLDAEGNELTKILPYRRYIDTVQGLKLDITDTKSVLLSIEAVFLSEEGGQKWLKNTAIFTIIIVLFWFLGRIFGKAVTKALSYSRSNSAILNNFIINSIRRIVFFIGILIALSYVGVSIAPLLAVIGAAGFIIAFALQSTLSNFASGLMIMFYRPFDIHDIVEVAGITGTVKSMTLVSTAIMTFDNKLMLVPNNSIWGDVIINAHYSAERRVDMVFGIGYGDDIGLAIQVMSKVLAAHPLVLDEPEATVQVSELADSSVNFICRPWVKTTDYWTVYWDVTRTVKEEFDAAGISIPFPQTDVHIHQQAQTAIEAASILASPTRTNKKSSSQAEELDADSGSSSE